ncbi:MAG: hypothetical protein ACJA0Q_001516 [Saprospiraceae bacterium]|jgi:hypothetical protein
MSTISYSQISLEEQVADSACACLSAIDTAKINSQSNGLKMACLQKAMIQNKESITKEYSTSQRKEEDQAKIGIRGSLMIKVQNILTKKCVAYKIFETKIQERRMP